MCSLRGPDLWEEGAAGEARKLQRGAQDQALVGQVQNRRRPRADAQCRDVLGREVGWCASPGGCCLLHPCCRSRCLPAGLLGCLGHLWAPGQWSPGGPWMPRRV